MTVWLPLMLIALAAFGVFRYKAHVAKVRRTAACEESRHLATERLEKVILESTTTKPTPVQVLEGDESAYVNVRIHPASQT